MLCFRFDSLTSIRGRRPSPEKSEQPVAVKLHTQPNIIHETKGTPRIHTDCSIRINYYLWQEKKEKKYEQTKQQQQQ